MTELTRVKESLLEPTRYVDTYAELLALPIGLLTDGRVVGVLGALVSNDGGGGTFRYNASGNANLHDGGTILSREHSLASNPGTGTWCTQQDQLYNER